MKSNSKRYRRSGAMQEEDEEEYAHSLVPPRRHDRTQQRQQDELQHQANAAASTGELKLNPRYKEFPEETKPTRVVKDTDDLKRAKEAAANSMRDEYAALERKPTRVSHENDNDLLYQKEAARSNDYTNMGVASMNAASLQVPPTRVPAEANDFLAEKMDSYGEQGTNQAWRTLPLNERAQAVSKWSRSDAPSSIENSQNVVAGNNETQDFPPEERPRTAATRPSASHTGREAAPWVPPGAYAIDGPLAGDSHSVWTVQIGGETTENPDNNALEPTSPLDATIVGESQQDGEQEMEDLPPLVEAEVDKSWTLRDRRVQLCLAVSCLIVVVAAVLGVVFGITSGGSTGATPSPTIAGIPTEPVTRMPTSSPVPTASPTSLGIVSAGSLVLATSIGLPSVPASLSPNGTRLALVDSTGTVTVYQDSNGSWLALGEPVVLDGAVSACVVGDLLAIGATGSVRVLQLINGEWTGLVGNIVTSVEIAWTVALGNDTLAVEDTSQVTRFRLQDNVWQPQENVVQVSGQRTNAGNTFQRMALSQDGSTMVADLSVYQQGTDAVNLPVTSDVPETPIISGNGKVAAVAQYESNANGLNTGIVHIFENSNGSWNTLGVPLIGDSQVNGRFGWSCSLSGDGTRMAVTNNPSTAGGQSTAIVYQLQSGQWAQIFTLPTAFQNGAIQMSFDGTRVAIVEQSNVEFYDIVSET